MIRCEPDKVRFCGPEEGPHIIHTVDLSDQRSVRQFLTFWTKGRGERVQGWAASHGLDGHHQREVYHREPPWLPAMYPGKESGDPWSNHYHVDLSLPPTWEDIEPYTDEMPPEVQEAIRRYLKE